MLKMAYFHAYWALFCIKVALVTDPAAGSGSLLIRAADEAPVGEDGNSIVTIFGQDNSTSGLARMNLILHQKGTGTVLKGNTLTNPQFTDDFGQLRRFDFVVMIILSTSFSVINDNNEGDFTIAA